MILTVKIQNMENTTEADAAILKRIIEKDVHIEAMLKVGRESNAGEIACNYLINEDRRND